MLFLQISACLALIVSTSVAILRVLPGQEIAYFPNDFKVAVINRATLTKFARWYPHLLVSGMQVVTLIFHFYGAAKLYLDIVR